jgi:hypothetical protein
MLASICVFVLLIPATHSASSWILAVSTVFALLTYQWMLRKGLFELETSPNPSETNPSDR